MLWKIALGVLNLSLTAHGDHRQKHYTIITENDSKSQVQRQNKQSMRQRGL